ncbi:unnamed protein product [Paramecium octaurelia]|uniref:Nascent polypeptide-associated complex subunit beta n=1 Tax=Paramecium octaurelia TaxID=43137 RepID=A0A8S1TI01_PAROT|nr:unnamed protein product [Paramecium octaurelia]
MSNNKEQIKAELEENRKKLAEKFGQTKMGSTLARRKHKNVHQTQINDDKKLKQVIKKFGVQQLGNIDEVNFFKDDNTIIHFSKPEVQAAIGSNTFAIFGNPETKKFAELMPEILNHIGPNQMGLLQELMKENQSKEKVEKIAEADAKDEDDIPVLVQGQNFEEASKKE